MNGPFQALPNPSATRRAGPHLPSGALYQGYFGRGELVKLVHQRIEPGIELGQVLAGGGLLLLVPLVVLEPLVFFGQGELAPEAFLQGRAPGFPLLGGGQLAGERGAQAQLGAEQGGKIGLGGVQGAVSGEKLVGEVDEGLLLGEGDVGDGNLS